MKKAVSELKHLERQTAQARELLARLQISLIEAGNNLGGEASLLIEANQQLVLSAINAQVCAETAARSAELDVLTALPNRRVLLDRFEQAIVAAKRRGSWVALLFLDIDNLKHINDTLGHAVGDKILQNVARCMTDVVRKVDTVSRHGGDEFLILLTDISHRSDATRVADKIREAFSAPYRVNDQVLNLSVSIGISFYPDHGEDAVTLIQHADTAMYHAKRKHVGRHFNKGDNDIGLAERSSSSVPNNVIEVEVEVEVEVETEKRVREAKQLLEANEQLVIATLSARADVEAANTTLEKMEQSIDLEVVTRASQSKSEFLSRVSHELRTPLNAIMGFSHLMLIDDNKCNYLDAEQRDRLEAIRLAGQQLLSLTNDMLDIARIERGSVQINMQSVDVHALISSSEILLRTSALEYGVKVRNLNRENDYWVMADERALGQVLLNLISNAVKYNHPGGQVTVSTKIQFDEIHIAVEDDGLGMSPAQLADLFQPFNRVGAERSAMPGCGMGLVISKALVELMGGKLSVSSVEGAGTRMEIRLCKSQMPIALPADNQKVEPLLLLAQPRTAKCAVLYVEDNPVNAMIMQQLFAAEPAWTLSIATTGQIGIELATSLRPSLVILDMQLPDMTGSQVFLALEKNNILPPRGCIALSADAMPEQVATALKAGFSQYWTKPIDIQKTLDSLREILRADRPI